MYGRNHVRSQLSCPCTRVDPKQELQKQNDSQACHGQRLSMSDQHATESLRCPRDAAERILLAADRVPRGRLPPHYFCTMESCLKVLVVVELQTHAVMNLIVFQSDVILEDVVPFLCICECTEPTISDSMQSTALFIGAGIDQRHARDQKISGQNLHKGTCREREFHGFLDRGILHSKADLRRRILSALVPVCAAISFFKSPIVSSGLHLTRIWRV